MLVGCRMVSWTNKIKDDQTNSFIAIILERPVQIRNISIYALTPADDLHFIKLT